MKPRTVPLLDRKRSTGRSRPRSGALDVSSTSQAFILGDEVRLLEEEIASRLGAAHAIGVASGSDALLLSLVAADVGPGDEVVTTPFTFFASAGAIARAGARPVFVNIDPGTFNIEPRSRRRIDPRTKAILPVHLFGGAREWAPSSAAARTPDRGGSRTPPAIDAQWQGRSAGTIGDFGGLSLFPSKNLGGFGDAGMVPFATETRPRAAERVRKLRTHGGQDVRHEEVGINSRLDASRPRSFARAAAPRFVATGPQEPRGADTAALRRRHPRGSREAPERPPQRAARLPPVHEPLREAAMPFRRSSPPPGSGARSITPCPFTFSPASPISGTEKGRSRRRTRATKEVLSLPISPVLREEDQKYVVHRIRAFYRGERRDREGRLHPSEGGSRRAVRDRSKGRRSGTSATSRRAPGSAPAARSDRTCTSRPPRHRRRHADQNNVSLYDGVTLEDACSAAHPPSSRTSTIPARTSPGRRVRPNGRPSRGHARGKLHDPLRSHDGAPRVRWRRRGRHAGRPRLRARRRCAARIIGWVCVCGVRLPFEVVPSGDATCSACNARYAYLSADGIVETGAG